jgi:HEAT repeat protein
MSHSGSPFRFETVALTGLAVIVALMAPGCGSSEHPAVSKARQVFQEKFEERPEYASYGFSIAAQVDEPFARGLTIGALSSDRYPTALEAVRAISDNPPEEAREALQAVFAEKKGSLKVQSAVALARLGDDQAAEWLKAQVASGAAAMNPAVVTLLAAGGAREVVEPALREAAASDDAERRNEAYAILGEIRESWSTGLLLEGLEKEFGEERLQAIVSLGRAGDASASPTIQRFINTQGLVFASIEALGRLGDPNAVKGLEGMAEHDEPLVRAYAGAALWKLGDAETARAVLDPLVTHEDESVRRNVAEQLSELDDAAATSLLATLCKDSAAAVRSTAVRSLGARTSAEAAAALLGAIGDSSADVKILALNGLAGAGGADAIPSLAPLLDDPNPYVALSAAHGILAIHDRISAATG